MRWVVKKDIAAAIRDKKAITCLPWKIISRRSKPIKSSFEKAFTTGSDQSGDPAFGGSDGGNEIGE